MSPGHYIESALMYDRPKAGEKESAAIVLDEMVRNIGRCFLSIGSMLTNPGKNHILCSYCMIYKFYLPNHSWAA